MHFTCVLVFGWKERAQEPVITFHVIFCTRLFVLCCMDVNIDGSLSLTCVFPFCSKPSALSSARMKEPAQLQIHAVVPVDGLDSHVKKVWTALDTYCNASLAVIVLASTPIFHALYMCMHFGRENVHRSL